MSPGKTDTSSSRPSPKESVMGLSFSDASTASISTGKAPSVSRSMSDPKRRTTEAARQPLRCHAGPGTPCAGAASTPSSRRVCIATRCIDPIRDDSRRQFFMKPPRFHPNPAFELRQILCSTQTRRWMLHLCPPNEAQASSAGIAPSAAVELLSASLKGASLVST